LQIEASLGKKLGPPPISINKPGVVVHFCNPSCIGGISRRITFQASLSKKKKKRRYPKITKAKRAGGMAQVALVYQVQGHEFTCQKVETKKLKSVVWKVTHLFEFNWSYVVRLCIKKRKKKIMTKQDT
jgi:hypothetical protein